MKILVDNSEETEKKHIKKAIRDKKKEDKKQSEIDRKYNLWKNKEITKECKYCESVLQFNISEDLEIDSSLFFGLSTHFCCPICGYLIKYSPLSHEKDYFIRKLYNERLKENKI